MGDRCVCTDPCGPLPYGEVVAVVVRVLVALELRTYRQAIASALQYSRPRAAVSVSDPEDLDSEMERLEPHVVICSQSTQPVRDGALGWVKMLIVGEELRAVVNVKGLASTIVSNIHLSQLVALIDRAEAVLDEADQQ
jgi:hypothetical protein